MLTEKQKLWVIEYSIHLLEDTILFHKVILYRYRTNDGDEIVKIIEFQDRLFVYKKRKLFIIDISSPNPGEYKLIGEFDNRGVSNPGAVVKSDLGIVWANENGLFGFFEGIAKLSRQINDKNGIDGWADIVDADNVQLGFIPLKNQILIVANANSASSKGYIYDITTQSFVNVDTNSVIFNNEITLYGSFSRPMFS